MKKTSLFTGIALGLLAIVPVAQADVKIGYVDINEVAGNYYKMKEAQNRLKESQASINNELKTRADNIQKLRGELNELNLELRKPELSDQAKQKKQKDLEEQVVNLREMEEDINRFRNERGQELQRQHNRMMVGIFKDINEIIAERVKLDGYDLVLNKSAGPGGIPTVLYSNETADFSKQVIEALNKKAPKESASEEKAESKSDDAKKADKPAASKKK